MVDYAFLIITFTDTGSGVCGSRDGEEGEPISTTNKLPGYAKTFFIQDHSVLL